MSTAGPIVRGRGWRRARVAKGAGGGAARGRLSGRLATVRIASGLADRSQTVSRITDSTAGTSRTSSPSRTRSATRPAARTSEAAAWTRASSAVGTATSARTIPVRIETLASDFTLRSAARARPAADAADPGTLAAAGRALAALRKVKSEAKVSMRTGIVRAEVAVPTAELALVQAAASDVRAAGRVADLVLLGDDVRDVPAVLSVILETV